VKHILATTRNTSYSTPWLLGHDKELCRAPPSLLSTRTTVTGYLNCTSALLINSVILTVLSNVPRNFFPNY